MPKKDVENVEAGPIQAASDMVAQTANSILDRLYKM